MRILPNPARPRSASPKTKTIARGSGRDGRSAFSAVGRLSADFIVQDGVVPRSRLGQALATIEALSRQHEIRVANVFHAGDGNLHPLILYDGREPGAHDRAEVLAAEIIRLCIRLGGSITGEHGVGLEKRQFLAEMYDEASIDACVVAQRDGSEAAGEPRQEARRQCGRRLFTRPAPTRACRHHFAGMTLRPGSIEDLQRAVVEGPRLAIRGGGTKTGSGGRVT